MNVNSCLCGLMSQTNLIQRVICISFIPEEGRLRKTEYTGNKIEVKQKNDAVTQIRPSND